MDCKIKLYSSLVVQIALAFEVYFLVDCQTRWFSILITVAFANGARFTQI